MIWSTKFKNWLGMSHNRDMFMEQRFMRFSLTFQMTLKTRPSDIGSSRYHRKTQNNDLRQSVQSTKFENWLGMSCNHYIFVEIRVMRFPLSVLKIPKTCLSTIGSSRYREKTPKNNFRQSIWSTKFKNWQGMSRNRDMFREKIFVGFPLTVPMPPKTCHSNVGSSRYREKTPKKDLRQSSDPLNLKID